MSSSHGAGQDSRPPASADRRPRRPSLDPLTGAGLLGGALTLAVYLATMDRGLAFYDGAELALVARQLGVSHPIGQPLHTLLGALFARLPGLEPLLGLNLLSALAGAAAVPLAVALSRPMLSPGGRDGAGPAAEAAATPTTIRWPEALLGAAPATLVALHPTVWEAATRIEVYALATALVLAALVQGLGDLDPPSARGPDTTPGIGGAPRGRERRRWLGTGVLLGLGASANAFLALIGAAALAPALLRACWGRRLGIGALVAATGGGLLGLLPYLQVPLSALAAEATTFVWGDPTTPEGLAHYFGGKDYDRNVGVGLGQFLVQGGRWVGWAAGNGHLALLVLGLAGLGALGGGWRGPRLLGALVAAGLSVALIARYTLFHPDIPDYVDYQALALWLSTPGIPALVLWLSRRPPRGGSVAVFLLLGVGALAVLPAPSLATRAGRAGDRLPDRLAELALEEAPPNAVLVAQSDHLVFPLMYLQRAAGRRTDVVLIPWSMAGSSWVWRDLQAVHPDLPSFPLRGPGGRAGRIRRLLAASPGRPLLVETRTQARALGWPVCQVGLLARVGPRCGQGQEGNPSPRAARVTGELRALLDRGPGPTAREALALVGVVRGDLLWTAGRPAAAYRAYGAGVPGSLSPGDDPPEPTAADLAPAAGRLPGGLDRPFARFVPLGEPARNLLRQGQLLLAAGRGAEAAPLVLRAAELGLPEARALVEAATRLGADSPGEPVP